MGSDLMKVSQDDLIYKKLCVTMTKDAVSLSQAQKEALNQYHIGFKAQQIKALLIIEVLGLFSKCHESQATLSLPEVPWFDLVRVTLYYSKQLKNRPENL